MQHYKGQLKAEMGTESVRFQAGGGVFFSVWKSCPSKARGLTKLTPLLFLRPSGGVDVLLSLHLVEARWLRLRGIFFSRDVSTYRI